jgi:predicted NBD/HSP70 family sugar kinase
MPNPVTLLKDRHRQMAFELLSRRREVSRVEIARELDVSLQTAMKIMGYFTDCGLASRIGGGGTRLGRKPQMYAFNPDAAHIVAVVNEGGMLRAGVLDLACELLAEESAELRGGIREMLVEQPCGLAERLLSRIQGEARPPVRVLGLGMCLPGVVDDVRRNISFAPSLDPKATYEIGALIDEAAERIGLPIIIENDVNAAVLGELLRHDTPDLAFISLGSGVGMGLVLDGKLRHGAQFSAGEIGMMPYEGSLPASGIRSVEDAISLGALKKRFGFDRQFGAQAMNPETRTSMVGAIADAVAHIAAVASAMMDIADFVVGGLTVELLGEELLGEIRRRTTPLSPFPVTIHGQSHGCPALVGAAQKVLGARMGELLSMDGSKQPPDTEGEKPCQE